VEPHHDRSSSRIEGWGPDVEHEAVLVSRRREGVGEDARATVATGVWGLGRVRAVVERGVHTCAARSTAWRLPALTSIDPIAIRNALEGQGATLDATLDPPRPRVDHER